MSLLDLLDDEPTPPKATKAETPPASEPTVVGHVATIAAGSNEHPVLHDVLDDGTVRAHVRDGEPVRVVVDASPHVEPSPGTHVAFCETCGKPIDVLLNVGARWCRDHEPVDPRPVHSDDDRDDEKSGSAMPEHVSVHLVARDTAIDVRHVPDSAWDGYVSIRGLCPVGSAVLITDQDGREYVLGVDRTGTFDAKVRDGSVENPVTYRVVVTPPEGPVKVTPADIEDLRRHLLGVVASVRAIEVDVGFALPDESEIARASFDDLRAVAGRLSVGVREVLR